MTSCAQKTLQMKSRDSEVISTSSGNSKGSDYHKGSTFNLRRFFHRRRNRNRSKSRSSLDSDSARSEVSFNITNANATGIAMLPNSNLQVPVFQNLPKELRRREDGSGSLRECPVCLIEQEADQFPEIMTCHHRTCYECLRRYLRIEISESRVAISCPECTEKFHPKDIHMILQDDAMMAKYEEFMLRRVLANDPDARWCPAPDCGYVVIAAGCAGCPKLKCEVPGCDTYFCYHCKLEWHPNQTCDAARAERYPEIRSPSLSYSNETASQRDDVKPCPRCKALLIKINDGSCNHMTCAVCGAEFCWLCMKEISDLHYLSPSGCTFWGKKPWSRKKKIMWQLGTLIGAPLGISLVASIAVPAMVIGIPVWVGRKLHSKYNGRMSKHKRNLVIAGGVLASVFLSPIIAGLAVGIGVPILLAYVYGVVPVSLCRSGGCGVTTNTGGVRFEFDEGNPTGKFQFRAADSQSVDTTHNVANPSIAPSIGDASLGMTNSLSASGSHLDRVGVLRDESDRDSASNRAIAGSSLNGSLCGSVYATAGYQNKLEVQVDVSTVAEEVTKASASGKGDMTPKPLKKERSILQKKLEAADSPPETEFQREGIMSWDVDINDVNALLALFQQDSFEVMSTITEASSIQPTSSSSGASRNLNQPSPMPSLHHTRLFSQSEMYGKGLSPSPFLLTSLPESAEQPSPLLSKSCPELGTSDSRVSESSSSVHSDTDLLSTRTDSC